MALLHEKAYRNKMNYNLEYQKENYIKRGLTLKHEENEKILKILEAKGITFKQYVMDNVEKDYQDIIKNNVSE